MNPFATHGVISWSEYLAADLPRALAFYQELLGWSVEEMPMQSGDPYHVLVAGSHQTGGIMACPPGVPPCWTYYVTVHGVREWLKRNDLNILVPLTDTPVGPFLGFVDPQGAFLQAIQYAEPQDSGEVPDVAAAYGTHGAVAWFELRTSDPAAAAEWYSDLFGWTVKEEQYALGPYITVSVDGTGIAGISQLPPGVEHPHWSAYVTVDDIDALETKARALGATIHAPPVDLPGVGRIMHIADPAGVTLSFAQWDLDPQ